MRQDQTVGQLVVERPARARVFEKLGIDYCCGGKRPLEQVCSEKGLDVGAVVQAIQEADTVAAPDERDWATASLGELADHIEATHHAYLKAELPRLDYLTGRVLNAHGRHRPELQELRQVFLAYKAELESHMMKEERVLFPMCRDLDRGVVSSAHCGSIGNPIAVMMREHDDAGEALSKMRELTGDYAPPEGACNTYRAMLAGLAEMEANMHQHVHKENNILFPRAVEAESRLSR